MNKTDNTTVKELIQLLKNFPEDLPVLVDGYESGFEHFYTPYIQTLKYEPENMYFDGEYQRINNKHEKNIDAVVLQRMLRHD